MNEVSLKSVICFLWVNFYGHPTPSHFPTLQKVEDLREYYVVILSPASMEEATLGRGYHII